ncbi:MAG: hypothetical protein P1P77_07415 [Spirochaetaceae bacterium]|nr:hypothetical protein [Spirochaetaceae bacterium]
MIIMLVAEDAALKSRFTSFFGPLGYDVIQYSHPLKAMDNLDEIAPDVVICQTLDYPRHWKLIVKHIRETRERDDAVVILGVDDSFDTDEVNKAAFLGVNLLYPERLETIEDFRELDDRISRYKAPPKRSHAFTWIPGEEERISFIFLHPVEFRMISGRLTELSPAGGIFRPDDPGDIAGIDIGALIDGGSLRAGESLLSIKARVIRNSGTLSLAFVEFADDGFQNLIDEMSLRVASI